MLDRFAAKLSYNRLVNIMPLPSIYEGHVPHKFEPYYKPPQVFVHDASNGGASGGCRNKAWSQNLGHENPLTTFTSYGHIDLYR